MKAVASLMIIAALGAVACGGSDNGKAKDPSSVAAENQFGTTSTSSGQGASGRTPLTSTATPMDPSSMGGSVPAPATTTPTTTHETTGPSYGPTGPSGTMGSSETTGSTGSSGTRGSSGSMGSSMDTTSSSGTSSAGTSTGSGSTHGAGSAAAAGAAGAAAVRSPAPATSPRSDADNTRINQRDRSGSALTPFDQGGSASDRTITQKVRQAVVGDKSLSFTAKNVKIITIDGKVTLRGPVNSEQERTNIEAKAKSVPGVKQVDNQLDVKAH